MESYVAALVAIAPIRHKRRARRFLSGLSTGELLFLAGFAGAWTLEASEGHGCGAALAERIASIENPDSHKLILLREFLWHSGWRPIPVMPRVQRA
jgi:hypothetical protein